MSVATFTVSEIAERIREPGEKLPTVIERLRSWTKQGILKPLGARNPGTGTKLQYHEHTIIEAAVISKLSQLLGIPAPRVPSLAQDAFYLSIDAASMIQAKTAAGELIYLVVSVNRDRRHRPIYQATLQFVPDEETASQDPGRSPDGHPVPQLSLHFGRHVEVGVAVNLTSLFTRINIPVVGES